MLFALPPFQWLDLALLARKPLDAARIARHAAEWRIEPVAGLAVRVLRDALGVAVPGPVAQLESFASPPPGASRLTSRCPGRAGAEGLLALSPTRWSPSPGRIPPAGRSPPRSAAPAPPSAWAPPSWTRWPAPAWPGCENIFNPDGGTVSP
ncbi:MAG: hypothetical protein U1G05_04835 [Kiritimatiellia bacterium]